VATVATLVDNAIVALGAFLSATNSKLAMAKSLWDLGIEKSPFRIKELLNFAIRQASHRTFPPWKKDLTLPSKMALMNCNPRKLNHQN